MGAFRTILYEIESRVAYVTLNRPQVLNVCNIQMRDELYEVLGAIRDDPEVKVVVFKGAGEKAFCAGADLTEFLTAPSPVLARRARWERDIWGRFLSITKPFVAAVHGYVLGSGLEISLYCDIRVASEDAMFGLPEAGLGIMPAAGGSQTLPRMVGPGSALEILETGRLVNAREALRMGLVNRVVPRDALLREVGELAGKISGFDSMALSCAKQAVMRGLDMSLDEGLELEARLASSLPGKK